jgi:cell division protein FtsI/penicillin-binding protein 2
MNKRFVGRIRWLAALFIVVALVIVGRLYILQIIRGKQYIARANAQFTLPQDPLIDRATIYFTGKDATPIVAATLQDGFSLALNPTKITDPEALYAKINPIVPIDHDTFVAKATKKGTQYALVANHLETAAGQKLEALGLTGIVIAEDRWREYPGGTLAAQTLGFVAYNGDQQEGRYGLESQYDATLTRSDQDLYTNFFVQVFGSVKSALQGNPLSGDVITTIEPSVQAELERTLVEYNSTWHPKLSGGVVMDPKTGEIVAMAVNPTFDLNLSGQQTDPKIFANPMVENVYEMGSIIKPLTVAAGIDSGAITAESTYNDTGCITVDTKKICNFDFQPRGVIPMQQILSQSLNVGASYVATQVGTSSMRNYFLNKYALGSTTGIDLPGEIHGLVNNLASPRLVEFDTASFGQGIAITPIETARALGVLASGGYLVTPHIVKSIHYDTGVTKDVAYPAPVQVLKPQTATTLSRMLTSVVDLSLAKGGLKLDHYSVAAKTGTAQIVDPTTGKYYPDKYLHSFFGYFPSYDARFIVFLFAYQPVGAPYASQTWAPPFHTLTQFLINYYDIPPDR